MVDQKWKARWIDSRGNQREYIFYSLPLRLIARIDFQLKCQEQGIACPHQYTLEEMTPAIPSQLIRRDGR